MTYNRWKTTEPGNWDGPDQVEQCDCCGAPNVPLTFLTVSNGTTIHIEWLCEECLPNDEPLDPMRGIEWPPAYMN